MKNIKSLLMILLVGMLALTTYACSTDEPDNGDNGDVETTTISFYNSEGWDSVYAYTDDADLLGDAPGTAATEGENDWWTIDVTVNVLSNPINITFNDGDGNEAETAYVNHPNNVFVSYDGDALTTRRQVVELYGTHFRVYFYNAEDWESINAYSWHDGGALVGDWPGSSVEEEGDGWFYIDIPGNFDDFSGLNIIFNGQLDGEDVQNDDLAITHADTVYVTPNNHVLNSKDVAEEFAAYEDDDFLRFNFYNEDGWENIHAYIFGTNEVFGGWPGVRATADEDNENWYYVDAPVDPEEEDVTIIFNADGDNQTGNIEVPTADHVYIASTQTEDGEAYTSFEDASGMAPTYTTTVEFWNIDGWDNVYVNASDNEGVIAENEAMEADEDGWFTFDLVTEIEEATFTLTFNNGNGESSVELTFGHDESTVFAADQSWDNRNMATVWADYDTEDYVRYYFLNSEGWTDLNGYIWSDADGYSYQDMLGGWPGMELTAEDDSDWYYIDIPVTFTETGYANFIVNANDPVADDGVQTDNILLNSATDVYMTVNNETFDSKEAAEDSVDESLDNVELFTNILESSGSYTDDVFLGDTGVEWSAFDYRTDETYGLAMMFRDNAAGKLEATAITGGISELSVDLRAGFTGGDATDRSIEIFIDDVSVGSYTLTTMDEIETFHIDGLEIDGDFNLSIRVTGSRQISLGNLQWNGYEAPTTTE